VHRRELLQQRFKGHPCLKRGERRAQAVVKAAAKGEEAGSVPTNVKVIRLSEHLWIAIGRAEQQDDAMP
jgi:hypothetical protein